MKITRIKLVNFIGIKHGTDLDEVEIKFGKKKVVMLNGGNGSGKSTILSQLHPFKDSFDERKTVIIEGKDGLKEIDIEHEGNEYEIVHHYGKKAQSFIKKNGTEMNENGGVKTFEAFVESEFGVTSDYFKIGKIGSNTQNFIELTAAERKTYIAKFLPAIEDYQEKFEIVKEKFRVATLDIKSVSSELQSLEQEETLKSKIEILDNLIKTLDEDIEKSSNEAAVLMSDIENYNKDISKVDLAAIVLDINMKEAKKKEIEQFGVEFFNKYNYSKLKTEDLEKFIEEKIPESIQLSQEIAVLNSEKNSLSSSMISIKNEISKLEYNIKEIKTVESSKEIDEKLEKSKTRLSDLKKSNKDPLFKVISENQKDISNQLSKFEMFINFVIKYFNNLKQKSVVPGKAVIESFIEEDFIKILDSQSTTIRNLMQSKQSSLANKEATLSQKEEELIKLDKIYNGTADAETKVEICDTCPFVKNALEYKNLPKTIENLRKEIIQSKKDLEEFELKASNITELRSLFLNFTNNYEQMNPRTNQIYIYFVGNHGSIVSNIMGPINDFSTKTKEIVKKANDIAFSIQEIVKIETEIENLQYKKNLSENNESISGALTKSLSEKKDSLFETENKLKSILEEIKTKGETLITANKVLDDHKKHLEGRKERASLSTMISTLSTTRDEYSKKKEEIVSKTNKLNEFNSKLSDLRKRRVESNSEMIKSKTTLINVENLKSKKINLERDYNDLRILKDALDPNKGVPLQFIKAYLEKTKDIANELLELAFSGNFEIDFFTSDKEFYIKVRAGENIKNDIKEASQGEVALTTISISLALIEQAIGKYNILALDEIDGPLDVSNRSNFISILNKQIEKLGIEQVFVISHNDAFDTEEMDLILLRDNNAAQKGEDFMKNKEVIYEFKS